MSDLIVRAWQALNQSPISLDLSPTVRGLDMQAFLEKVVEAAVKRCGTSKEDVQLSMGDRTRRDQVRHDTERRHEDTRKAFEAEAATEAVDGFMRLVGR